MSRAAFGVTVSLSAVTLALVACGGSAGLKPLPIKARVIQHSEFRGFTPEDPTLFKSASTWVAAGPTLTAHQRKTEIARLTKDGFERDVTEFLEGPQGPDTGLSSVMQLGSARSARAELAAQFLSLAADETFQVTAIPGAFGYGFKRPTGGGENVAFTDGWFLYQVGYGWNGSADHPKRAALIAAAARLYKRVHGRPAA